MLPQLLLAVILSGTSPLVLDEVHLDPHGDSGQSNVHFSGWGKQVRRPAIRACLRTCAITEC